VEVLKTPESQFGNIEDFDFSPHFTTVDGYELAYIDKGIGPTVLLLHGEPSWSYLYRIIIKKLSKAGYRVISPDLIGFGRSDKPTDPSVYTYENHVKWIQLFIEKLGLDQINLFCQDWGGLIGLRLVAFESQRFSRVMASNTFLPNGQGTMPEAFLKWREYCKTVDVLDIGKIIQKGTVRTLTGGEIAAYNAPYPDESFKVGARIFPSLVPVEFDDPQAAINREAWKLLMKFEKPFLTAFGDSDPITKGGGVIMQKIIPGCKGLFHPTIAKGGHFIQEDKPEVIATILANFIKNTKVVD
jgi:haloalkane dehalogenase